MKAAVVRGVGQTPVYAETTEPVPGAGEVRVRVAASALSQVTRSRASGSHYSASGVFPFVAGIDGVGVLDDGSRVFFMLPSAPNGAMAEATVVAAARCLPVPDDLDDVTAAAIANPGVSSWAALTERARLKAGETVLINGATGIAGKLAVQIARHLGADRVIATGRRPDALASLGVDKTITLTGERDALEDQLKTEFALGIDVVIDYLWGPSAETILIAGAKAGREAVPIRYVQIGSSAGPEINLPSAVLRSSAIELMGSGLGSIPPRKLGAAFAAVLQATVPAGLKIATRTVALADVETAWTAADDGQRTVFVMNR